MYPVRFIIGNGDEGDLFGDRYYYDTNTLSPPFPTLKIRRLLPSCSYLDWVVYDVHEELGADRIDVYLELAEEDSIQQTEEDRKEELKVIKADLKKFWETERDI